jgi:serine/threonine-protein kinase
MEVNVISNLCPACESPTSVDASNCSSCGFLLTGPPQPMKIGDVLEARYRIDEEIGRGGMGVVYRGVDLTLKRPVAIKVVMATAADAGLLVRFMREARSLASVEHPGLVPVYAVGQGNGVYYMVMKLLSGKTLAQLISERGALEETLVRAMLVDICGALEALHKIDLIHSDLKPANVMMAPDGRITVMDLGIVKAVTEDAEGVIAATMGTPRYMPPEVFSNVEIDARADLYSLGVMAYHALAGVPPFEGPTPMAILSKQAHVKAVPLSHAVPTVSRGLADIIDRCLAKAPDDRFPTALALANAVRNTPMDKPRRRSASVAAFLVLMAVGGVAAWLLIPRPPESTLQNPPKVESKDAGQTKTQQARVDAAPPTQQLKPEAAPTIKLQLLSIPSGASVFEGRERLGRTPLVINRPAGEVPLSLIVRKRDHRPRRLKVRLDGDRTVKIELEPEFELMQSP